jgi:hypothetical protein
VRQERGDLGSRSITPAGQAVKDGIAMVGRVLKAKSREPKTQDPRPMPEAASGHIYITYFIQNTVPQGISQIFLPLSPGIGNN